MTFSTPVTPTRESPTGTRGARACTSALAPSTGAGETLESVACTSASVARADSSALEREAARDVRDTALARPSILVSIRIRPNGRSKGASRDDHGGPG